MRGSISKAVSRFLLFLFLFGALCDARAHVGNPYVFYEGNAGPYQVRVSIQPPEVVPGRAQINVRVHNGVPESVTALPVRWDAGRKGAPPPDRALPVAGETNLYSTELWLMDFGAYSVFVDVQGALGGGTAIVPLNSVSSKRLEMSKVAAAGFLAAGLLLVALLVMIVGAAVKESVLPPGAASELRRKRSRFSMAVAVVLLTLVLWRGNAWWEEVDAEFRNNRLFRPIEVPASIRSEGNVRVLVVEANSNDRDWRDQTPLVADHGKLMHLFLIKSDDMQGFAHLHPRKLDDERFEAPLPPLPEGEYSVYAEVTHESGLARTLVSKVLIPSGGDTKPGVDADDSWWPTADTRAITVRHLNPGPNFARTEVQLRFDAMSADGHAAPLEPYMGMWSHAAVRVQDGTVFTHLHPSGTISMTAQELFARRERGEDLKKPIDVMCGRPERELVFPYSFPKAGIYRMWVQVKSGGRVVTQHFDLEVLPPKA